jgi:hypothetical protein
MTEVIEWPDFDKHQMFELNKVINELDFLPVHFVRLLLQETKLLRAQRGKLVLTRLGKKMLTPEQHGALQALLFHIALAREPRLFRPKSGSIVAPKRCRCRAVVVIAVGRRMDAPGQADQAVHGPRHRRAEASWVWGHSLWSHASYGL